MWMKIRYFKMYLIIEDRLNGLQRRKMNKTMKTQLLAPNLPILFIREVLLEKEFYLNSLKQYQY